MNKRITIAVFIVIIVFLIGVIVKQSYDLKNGGKIDNIGQVEDVAAEKTVSTEQKATEPAKNENQSSERVKKIYEDGQLKETYSGVFDFNSDGTEEEYNIMMAGSNNDIIMTMGGLQHRLSTEGCEASIRAIYMCNLYNNGNWSLAVITSVENDTLMLCICTYGNGSLIVERFKGDSLSDKKFLGHMHVTDIAVNNDNTITLKEQTSGMGMWCISKTYKKDSNGYYTEIIPQYYKIADNFMNIDFFPQDISGKELEMWKKGYAMAHTDLSQNGFNISRGEYFKIVYDNNKDSIYITKEDGTAAWVNNQNWETFYNFNENLFFMAG